MGHTHVHTIIWKNRIGGSGGTRKGSSVGEVVFFFFLVQARVIREERPSAEKVPPGWVVLDWIRS